MKILCVFVLLFNIIWTTAVKNLPSDFKKCGRKNVDFEDCIQIAVDVAIKNMKSGLPEYGVQPIDPLHINRLVIGNHGSSPLTLQQIYSNTKVKGLGDLTVTKVRTNTKKTKFIVDSRIENLEIFGDYEMNGKILILPITGKGVANITIIKNTVKAIIDCEQFESHGNKYIKSVSFKVKMKPERAYYNFTNLFNGDKLLADNMLKFLDQNWELVFNEVKDGYEQAFSEIFKDTFNKIYTKVPENIIYLN